MTPDPLSTNEFSSPCCEWPPSFWLLEWQDSIAGQPFPEFLVAGPRIDQMADEFETLLMLKEIKFLMATANYRRLERFGLRDAADTYKEEVRKRLAQEQGGKDRDRAAVRQQSEEAMWELFEPICEQREAERQAAEEALRKAKEVEPPAPQLNGMPTDADSVLDPDYTEGDPGRQLRDAWLWVVMEWIRVIRDTDEGPIASIEAAASPPPNPFALFVLSTYALSGIDKRRELITRALGFATKSHDTPPDEPQGTEGDGFLDSL